MCCPYLQVELITDGKDGVRVPALPQFPQAALWQPQQQAPRHIEPDVKGPGSRHETDLAKIIVSFDRSL
jgi:hypothetical protein